MKLQDGMLLFHASYVAIENIDLSKCMGGKDFGRGFYLTSDAVQARNFIKSSLNKAKNYGLIPYSQNYGFVTSFRFCYSISDIRIYEFEHADKEWLYFISKNRRKSLSKNLISYIDPSIFKADIIIGKVANDTTNPVITTFLNGLYGDITSDRAVSIAIEQLLPDHLKDQFCFLTENAVSCLKFQEARKYVV